jgi:Flp pilus assembly pilin Flp
VITAKHGAGFDNSMTAVDDECARRHGGGNMISRIRGLWPSDEAQDIAEYAVMLAVILVLVVGTIRLIGGNANNAFSATASSIGQ